MSDREASDNLVRVDIDAQPIETALCIKPQFLAVDEETTARLAGEIDVLGNGKMRNEVEFLMDDGDAGGFDSSGDAYCTLTPLCRMVPSLGW